MNIRYRRRVWVNVKGGSYPVKIPIDLNIDMDYYREIHRLMKLKTVSDGGFIRVGNFNDGGYVMLDDFDVSGAKIAYSFGINDDVSWDDGMANKGYTMYMYDPTISVLPKKRAEFRFFRRGIAGRRVPDKSLDTLEHLMLINGHLGKKHMILKMDVEGYEWEFLETVDETILEKFDQILFEFHEIITASSVEKKLQKLHALEKLNKTHHLIHLHGNNCDSAIYLGEACIPNVLEATYVNRKRYSLEDADIILPISLDAPNSSSNEELVLGKWNDVKLDVGRGIYAPIDHRK